MASMILTCPYCGQKVSIGDKECPECGCPMTTILSELLEETTQSARETLAAHGISISGEAAEGAGPEENGHAAAAGGLQPEESFDAGDPVAVYKSRMAALAADPRTAALFEELALAGQKVREARRGVSILRGRKMELDSRESQAAKEEQTLAGLKAEYNRIGGLFAGMKREKKMREIQAATGRLEKIKTRCLALRQKYPPEKIPEAQAQLEEAMAEESRVRDRISAYQGPDVTAARQAIMNDGRLLEKAISDPAAFAYLDCDLFFKSGLDPAGAAVKALAGSPEALARLQVKNLPADLLEEVEGSYRTSVLGSYGWTPTSLARWIEQCCREQPALAGYEIMTDVLPAYFGVKPERGPQNPVEILLLKDGKPVLAVHTASTANAKAGMGYVKRRCRKLGIAYTHLLTDYPNLRHYVVRRLLEAMEEG